MVSAGRRERMARARRGEDFDVRLLEGGQEVYRYRVADGEVGLRLDQFLAKRLSWRSRTSARKLLDEGLVEIAGRSPRPSRKVKLGETVSVRLPRPLRDEALLAKTDSERKLSRLFEDEHLIAIDKPPNIPVHPSGRLLHHTVITELHKQYRDFEDASRDVVPKLCHRLDLETSGVLLVGKQHRALVFVQKQFEKRTVRKEYLVLVHGELKENEGLIDLPIGPSYNSAVRNSRSIRHDVGQPSRTEWRVLKRYVGYTQCHIILHTGRHHQIRVHMSALGYPVVGDKIYGRDEMIFTRHAEGALTKDDLEVLELPRQALHSHSLEFEHPTQGEVRIESPWPEDLESFCAGLEPFPEAQPIR
ncbi:MAG: RluA family pseudouridine synthase [Planctomycetota bacterium]|jgi:23S rRNA pseudouridine1911/1915/1917 synthase|nr:RluA family pseudouridine synthase [Planctomycetota bacterium]